METDRNKATFTKRWCLEQLNTFSVSGYGRCPRTDQFDGHVWTDYSKGVVRQRTRLHLQDVNLLITVSDDRSWRRPVVATSFISLSSGHIGQQLDSCHSTSIPGSQWRRKCRCNSDECSPLGEWLWEGARPRPREMTWIFRLNGALWLILSGIFENLGDNLHYRPPSPNSMGLVPVP